MTVLPRSTMLKAMLSADKTFDGVFYTGVKTTKIYCLPSCYAKKPLPENVIFFQSAADAENQQFRSCKKCFPDFLQSKWIDHKSYIELIPPNDFAFSECLAFLGRSSAEVLHHVEEGFLLKWIEIDGNRVMMKVSLKQDRLVIEFPDLTPDKFTRVQAAKYIWTLFDLDRDMQPFYELAEKDELLRNVVTKHYGLRIIGIPDLFEALTWAIIGQQINLNFAYTLKRRLIEQFSECHYFEGRQLWLFPKAEVIASLEISDLQNLQFTKRKAEYILGIAREISNGDLSKEKLLRLETDEARSLLLSIRGVGAWTADYVMMKCLMETAAFPAADVGLHHAIKAQLGLERKPSMDELVELSEGWQGWEAYAVFYLWRSLYQ
ncbi:DNA-3-methyladenine glycosylase [Bacillus sp. CMF21]|uniref:Ada metal-binding domain-containing protein n=1 Tax=Metabacillus dongyingensis TaxID=2874282 RepID=UPI001CBCC3B6|nr:Ada metal-binding domain-containing protein [Metabacillus dongyingensis]UAL53719.1 DNA-3-methyladenine glycosylase [Metabacillus dongyingensis]USK30029.1 DNA-3-methyladenine glycosylase [Bacillus sp. CMF21]